MIREYLDEALRRAHYEKLDDGSYYAEVPGLQGGLANAETLEECGETVMAHRLPSTTRRAHSTRRGMKPGEIASSALGGNATSVTSIGAGHGGDVFLVELTDGGADRCVVKLSEAEAEPPIDEEAPGDRVYGARWSNFVPAHRLLADRGFRVPEVYGLGTDERERRHYCVLEFLPGRSVREYLAAEGAPDLQIHTAVGSVLGQLHAIRRSHQGWVQQRPYATSWDDAFQAAFSGQLLSIETQKLLPPNELARIHRAAERDFSHWQPPDEFALSHVDGFQAIADSGEQGATTLYLVDIEDHQFTDQRFVLAGHELAMTLEGNTLPSEFWKAYREQTDVPAGYDEHSRVFQLFLLLVWLSVLTEQQSSANRESLLRIRARLDQLARR